LITRTLLARKSHDDPKFKNEPYIDWSKKQIATNRKPLLPRSVEILEKNTRSLSGVSGFLRTKNSTPLILQFVRGGWSLPERDSAIANKAMDVALAKFEEWKDVPPARRADYLFKAAKAMRKRRFELNAVEILEVGKTWPEADADVAEAIDFLEYYGREMLRYAGEHPVVKLPGEKGRLVYIPLGVGV